MLSQKIITKLIPINLSKTSHGFGKVLLNENNIVTMELKKNRKQELNLLKKMKVQTDDNVRRVLGGELSEVLCCRLFLTKKKRIYFIYRHMLRKKNTNVLNYLSIK